MISTPVEKGSQETYISERQANLVLSELRTESRWGWKIRQQRYIIQRNFVKSPRVTSPFVKKMQKVKWGVLSKPSVINQSLKILYLPGRVFQYLNAKHSNDIIHTRYSHSTSYLSPSQQHSQFIRQINSLYFWITQVWNLNNSLVLKIQSTGGSSGSDQSLISASLLSVPDSVTQT